jgi:hypothetical protein
MMRIQLIHTWSGPANRHRTMLVQTRRGTLFVWVHAFERPWRFAKTGILCVGLGLISFNLYTARAFQ